MGKKYFCFSYGDQYFPEYIPAKNFRDAIKEFKKLPFFQLKKFSPNKMKEVEEYRHRYNGLAMRLYLYGV